MLKMELPGRRRFMDVVRGVGVIGDKVDREIWRRMICFADS